MAKSQLNFVADALQSHIGNFYDTSTVLSTNRAALDSLGKILNCPCANDQQVLIPVCMAVHQTILQYEAALQAHSIDVSSSPPTVRNVSPQSSKDDDSFLDAQAQSLALAQITVSELRIHMPPLLLRLQQRQSGISSALWSSSSSNGMDSGIVECYQQRLREKCMAIISNASSLGMG